MTTETVTAAGPCCETELPTGTGLLMINGTVAPATFEFQVLGAAGGWVPAGSFTASDTQAIDTEVSRTVRFNVTGTPGAAVIATIMST